MNKLITIIILLSLVACTSSPQTRYAEPLPNFRQTPVPKVPKEIEKYRIKYNDQNIFKDSFTATVNEKDYEIKKLKRLIYHTNKDLKPALEHSYSLKTYRDWSLKATLIPLFLFFNNSKTIYLLAMAAGVGGYVYFDNQIKENNGLMFENYNSKLEKNFFYYKVNF